MAAFSPPLLAAAMESTDSVPSLWSMSNSSDDESVVRERAARRAVRAARDAKRQAKRERRLRRARLHSQHLMAPVDATGSDTVLHGLNDVRDTDEGAKGSDDAITQATNTFSTGPAWAQLAAAHAQCDRYSKGPEGKFILDWACSIDAGQAVNKGSVDGDSVDEDSVERVWDTPSSAAVAPSSLAFAPSRMMFAPTKPWIDMGSKLCMNKFAIEEKAKKEYGRKLLARRRRLLPDVASGNRSARDKSSGYKFRKALIQELARYPDPSECVTEAELRAMCERLTAAIQVATDEHVPFLKPSPYLKRWWNPDLTKARARCRRLARISEKWASVADHPIHAEYRDLAGQYGRMIDDAKAGHWEEWLETLDSHTVWTAHKYVDGVPLDTRSARVPTLAVPQADGSTQPVSDNAGKEREFYRVFFPPPPENLVLPDLDDDLRCYDDAPVITVEQIRRCVAKLAPYKAPGSDDIPNVVVKKSVDILETWLYWIFRACSLLHFYWEPWREFVTIVIRKPGRATYTVAKSFRPIVLYRWCPKLYAACVLDGLLWVVETRGLLPATHFGGRAGRCTTDSIHLLVQTVKDAWRGHKVASALFLDVAGAFPNAVPQRLLYNMRARGVPEGYVQIIDMLLRDRRTSIRFDDYETDTFDITNGISQGDPLSMILYLFYNSDLLDLGNGKQTLALGFVDDIGLLAVEGHDGEGWRRMRLGRCAQLPLGVDKTHLVDFCTSQKRRALGQRAEDLTIAGKTVKNTTCAKFLGLQLDSTLSFRPHAEAAIKKGMFYVSQISRLARTTRGLTGELARRLYGAVAIPRMTYAGDVWFTPIRETREGKLTGSICPKNPGPLMTACRS